MRLVELAASDALLAMREAAGDGRWEDVERLLAASGRRFAGHEGLSAMLQAMQAIAERRDTALSRKEMPNASEKLRRRLAAKGEAAFSDLAYSALPAYLRRKPNQGRDERP